jgi:hypothetical protein
MQNDSGITDLSAQPATAFLQSNAQFATPEMGVIILAGFVSVSVNVCAFGLIGKTSAVTSQVIGHCNEGETTEQFLKKIAGLVL